MSEKKYDLAVVVGRFQPFHRAHLSLYKQAAELAENVLILLGSAAQAPTPKNPFSASERKTMIRGALREEGITHPALFGTIVDDHYNDSSWISSVSSIIKASQSALGAASVVMVGHKKDDSSDYLSWFPDIPYFEHSSGDPLNATDIRKVLYHTPGNVESVAQMVPKGTLDFLRQPDIEDRICNMAKERAFIEAYQAPYKNLPYKPIFSTVDAVVVCDMRVLMVKRRAIPGKGLWALPGGFLNADERISDAIVRELREETGLTLDKGSCIKIEVFDAPQRSTRGRTITHCGLFSAPLRNDQLPRVKGSDDAERAKWIPISSLAGMREQIFEDHAHIINKMLCHLG